jgi:hypothetical protein
LHEFTNRKNLAVSLVMNISKGPPPLEKDKRFYGRLNPSVYSDEKVSAGLRRPSLGSTWGEHDGGIMMTSWISVGRG